MSECRQGAHAMQIKCQEQGDAKTSPCFFRFNENGMTLIEILVVLAIIAGVMGSFALEMNSASEVMRSEAGKLMGVIRYTYHNAAANALYSRIVFDLDEQKYWVENSEYPFYVVKEGDETEQLIQKNKEKNSFSSEDEEESENALTEDFAEDESDLMDLHEINERIRLSDIFVDHQAEPLSEGKAYLYFFPGGQTELAVIHFSDEEGENFVTMSVNPLTGWSDVTTEFIEHTEFQEDTKK